MGKDFPGDRIDPSFEAIWRKSLACRCRREQRGGERGLFRLPLSDLFLRVLPSAGIHNGLRTSVPCQLS